MSPTPKHSAGGASRPDHAVIVRHDIDAEGLPVQRVAPASLLSMLMHLALFGLFVLIAPRGQTMGPMEKIDNGVVSADDPNDERKPPFIATNVNPFEMGDDPFDATLTPSVGPESIPGAVDPNAVPGLPSGIESKLTSVPAPPGWEPLPTGPGRPRDGDGPPVNPGPPGGSGSFIPNKIPATLGGRGMSPEQKIMHGSTAATEAAVAKGLGWLARVQSPNGIWKLDGNFPDKGNSNDVAGTALGLLPFLGAGKTHKGSKDNPYDKPIEKAIRYLMFVQDKRTGAYSRDMYAHGLATIAISEAFALSQDYSIKKSAQNAVNFIVTTQHAGGGWRYSPGQAGDTSVSGWQIMALKSALMAGLDVPNPTLRKAKSYLDTVVDPKTEGSGYTEPQPTPTMTAVSLLCRQYLDGWGSKNLRYVKAVDNYIKPNSPKAARKDVYYYYYATQVMHHFAGDDWKAWNLAMREQIVTTQDNDKGDPSRWGSWSPAGDQWGQTGGRLMVTSLNLLTLEVYYRYLPLYYREK